MKGTAAAAATVVQPVVWFFLGYPFEAMSMLAALFACLIVRVYKGLTAKSKEGWLVDGCITALMLLFTAGWVIAFRPSPLYAILSGTGMGALGAALIDIAEKQMARHFPGEQEKPITDEEAIRRLIEQVKETP